MSNVVHLAEYRARRQLSVDEQEPYMPTTVTCECGDFMWLITINWEEPIAGTDRILRCYKCNSFIALDHREKV